MTYTKDEVQTIIEAYNEALDAGVPEVIQNTLDRTLGNKKGERRYIMQAEYLSFDGGAGEIWELQHFETEKYDAFVVVERERLLRYFGKMEYLSDETKELRQRVWDNPSVTYWKIEWD